MSEKGLLIAGQKRTMAVDGLDQAFPVFIAKRRKIALEGRGGFEQQLHGKGIVSQDRREIKPDDAPKPI
ncbi:MAG TPA: hypothetical protein PLB81_02140 [Deltaproteobacteria bacterium]|nr:hypothetical protein [Deltaproteobacteria bacterium]